MAVNRIKTSLCLAGAAGGRVPVVAAAEGSTTPTGWVAIAVEPEPHRATGCTCCGPRGPLSRALGAVWLAAVRDGRDLRGVWVRGATPEAVGATLEADAVCAARFRRVAADLLPVPVAPC